MPLLTSAVTTAEESCPCAISATVNTLAEIPAALAAEAMASKLCPYRRRCCTSAWTASARIPASNAKAEKPKVIAQPNTVHLRMIFDIRPSLSLSKYFREDYIKILAYSRLVLAFAHTLWIGTW
jgi:hypothetical protein